MGLFRMGPPEALVLALQRLSGATAFIETGTYRGDTAAWAAGHFPQVTTIELSPAYLAAAQKRFAPQPNVRVLGGDSPTALREVLPGLTAPAIFWLDAHWSGLDTAGQETECPLLEELALINAAPATHFVLIDDARLFSAPPPRPLRAERWPDLATTVATLVDGGRRYVVLYEDVLVGVPAAERPLLTAWLQEHPGRVAVANRLERWWARLRG